MKETMNLKIRKVMKTKEIILEKLPVFLSNIIKKKIRKALILPYQISIFKIDEDLYLNLYFHIDTIFAPFLLKI